MITITAEQIERVNLILSGVPGGIEKALSSTIRRANNTVRSETLKGITTVYAITRPGGNDNQGPHAVQRRRNCWNCSVCGPQDTSIPLQRIADNSYPTGYRVGGGACRKRAHAVSRRVHCENAKRTYRYVRARRFKAPAYQRVHGAVYGTDGRKQYRSCRRGGKGTRGHQQAR